MRSLAVLDVLVRQLQGALGGKTIRCGSASVSVVNTGTAGEGTLVVPHGLGVTPSAVLLTPNSSSGAQLTARAISLDATNFTIYVVRNAAASLSVTVYWLALA